MPTLYADGVYAATGLHQRGNTKYVTPRCCVLDRTYTFLGTELALDVIRFGLLAGGSIVLCPLSYATSDAIATTSTISVGDTGTVNVAGAVVQAAAPTRYAVALNMAAAGFALFSSSAGAALLPRFELSADSWLTVSLATLVTPVVGKKLRLVVFYTGA